VRIVAAIAKLLDMSSTASPTAVLDPCRLHLHLPRLTRFATRLAGSREAGEDLVQDTLERVLRSPRRVAGDEFPYLARALRNNHVDRVRSEARRVRTTAMPETLEAILPAPERAAAQLEAREVLAAVADLPDGYREVVVAVDVSGYSYTEAAELLGIPIGTVMSRLYRGRRRVVRALDP
jgi:RNA polymerase sigma-70 factor (ECF subfamily)